MANVVSIVLRALDQTKAGFTGPIKNLQDLEKRIDQVKPAMIALATTAAAAFGAMVNHAINTQDEMGKLAQKAGQTVEEFSSMAYAANESEVGGDKLAKMFKELSKNMVEASNPLSNSAQMFRQLGVSLQDANGQALSANQIIYQLADRFADSADDANKVSVATKLFGDKLGQDLIPFLNQGAAGIQELQKEAEELGQTFGEDAAKNADAFNDNMTKLKSALQGVANIVATELLPTMVEMTDGFVRWVKESGAVRGAANTLVDVFRIVDWAITSIVTAFRALWVAFETLGKIIGAAASTWVDYWEMTVQIAKDGAGVLFNVISGNWLAVASESSGALDRIQAKFDQFKNGIIDAGKDAAAGFVTAFNTLASGPAFPSLNAFGAGSESNPITVSKEPAKGSLPAITSTASSGGLLPSGYTMEAYQLDQDMMIRTKELMFSVNEQAMTLSQRRVEQLEIERLKEQERYQERMMQISELQMEETENYGLIEKAAQEHAARMAQIQNGIARQHRQSYLTMADSAASILGSMAATAQTFGKKGFAAYQAFSYAQALVSTLTGATRAFADFPWPVSAFVAAAVTAAGMANVAAIASTKPPQAHAGASFIPEEATYLLQRGERVLAPEQNQDLTKFLQGGGGASQVSVYLDGEILARGIGNLSRDGRLEISARAVV
jgi:hypothetical protein